MADRSRAAPENVPGAFFVDRTCIDCDTCRRLAPATFADAGHYSYVHQQPQDPPAHRRALHALLACPVASIGTADKTGMAEAVADFPLPLTEEVAYCGFTSSSSFGASSYFVQHPDGNWLIDSPRFVPALVRRFEAMGGIRWIFLTHRDDVADAARYAAHFGARRVIHRRDLAAQPDAELVIEGREPLPLHPDFLVIPTPGHTEGHSCLLVKDRYLFSGDHLWWDRERSRLGASRSVCWWSWPEQVASMERLLAYSFEWVLPGHGDPVHLAADAMLADLSRLVGRMRQAA